jgi:Ser/Thr protein kinase RdoA (MazF antagonist)
MHSAMDVIAAPYPLRRMDLAELLDRPFALMSPLLDATQHASATRLRARLRELLSGLSLGPPSFGLCHGDLYAANVAFDDDDRPTLFDFQSMEYGWRANDLAQFLWRVGRSWDDPDRDYRLARWEACATGYDEVRPLTARETSAVAAFVPTRALWYIGFRLRRGQKLDHAYFASRIAFLDAWMRSFKLW